MDDTSQLILTELREFRAAVTEWQQGTGERVSALETSVKSVIGNGQPGRLQVVERAVEAVEQAVEGLHRFKYWAVGFAAAVSAIAHYFWPGGKH